MGRSVCNLLYSENVSGQSASSIHQACLDLWLMDDTFQTPSTDLRAAGQKWCKSGALLRATGRDCPASLPERSTQKHFSTLKTLLPPPILPLTSEKPLNPLCSLLHALNPPPLSYSVPTGPHPNHPPTDNSSHHHPTDRSHDQLKALRARSWGRTTEFL